eukprot:CAMPEP_0197288058 /NCGR_PEP_ID=MMETSP0890-20130614/4960_1 /TAXON_ID=44058 ORGANISM="Aureoumbra lagunensis, Strain CCMP1510" /NCGR_SAMPLE_ID=MMETSP0890 /ASSEMBLY_ACC=CAM_ASM_000533 /LENGTH=243 /DNA_ID=CAMNT_0042758445 /DNA_START=117 /DNA_END=845 /DNA_ORIENTATION=+
MEDEEFDDILIRKEIWRYHVISYLTPSDILIFKQISRLGKQVSVGLFSERYIIASGLNAFIFDAETHQVIQTLKGHTDCIRCCKFSRDGRRVVTISEDDTAKIWDSLTGTILFTFEGNWARACHFSPDGTLLITASSNDYTARVCNAKNGRYIFILNHTDIVWDCAFAPDSKRIVTASFDFTARVWCAETGVCELTLTHQDFVNCCSFSHNGKYIVTGGDDDTARIWNASDGSLEKTLRHERW